MLLLLPIMIAIRHPYAPFLLSQWVVPRAYRMPPNEVPRTVRTLFTQVYRRGILGSTGQGIYLMGGSSLYSYRFICARSCSAASDANMDKAAFIPSFERSRAASLESCSSSFLNCLAAGAAHPRHPLYHSPRPKEVLPSRGPPSSSVYCSVIFCF